MAVPLMENFSFCAMLSSCTINLLQFMMDTDRFWISCGLIFVKGLIPVDTQRCFNVYKTSTRRRRRRIDVL